MSGAPSGLPSASEQEVPVALGCGHRRAEAGAPRAGIRRATHARTVGVGGRLAPLLVPHADPRTDRIQDALLRVSARLRVDADEPAVAVRRDVVRVHTDHQNQQEQPDTPLRPVPAAGDHPLHLLPGNNGRRGAEPRDAREHPAPRALPAPGDPAGRGPDLLLQPVSEPRGRVRLHHRGRHRAVLELARAARSCSSR